MNLNNYIHFHPKFLKGHDVFPFHIFIRHPQNKRYYLFCAGNDPLTKEKRQKLAALLKKGGIVAVQKSQRLTFIYYLDLNEESFGERGKKAFFQDPMLEEEEENKKSTIAQESMSFEDTPIFDSMVFRDLFTDSVLNENFLPIILKARKEISSFSVRSSETVSLAQLLSTQFMQEDTALNRLVALSYFFHRWLGIDEDYKLADVVSACFLCYAGLSQFERSKLNPFQIIDHNFSSLLIRTSEIELTPASIQYIALMETFRFTPDQIDFIKSDISAQFLLITKYLVEQANINSVQSKSPISDQLNDIISGQINSRLQFIPSDRICKIIQKLLIRFDTVKAA
jgi:hypothetical protein